MNRPQQPNSPRARLQQLLAIPERQRTDAEWDELNEIEIVLAVGNRDVIPQGVRRDGQPHQGQSHPGQGQGHPNQGHQKSNRGPDGRGPDGRGPDGRGPDGQQRKHKRPQKRKGR